MRLRPKLECLGRSPVASTSLNGSNATGTLPIAGRKKGPASPQIADKFPRPPPVGGLRPKNSGLMHRSKTGQQIETAATAVHQAVSQRIRAGSPGWPCIRGVAALQQPPDKKSISIATYRTNGFLFNLKVDHDCNCLANSAAAQLSAPQLYKICAAPRQWLPRGAGNSASLRAAFAFVRRRTRRAQDAAGRPAPNRPHGSRVNSHSVPPPVGAPAMISSYLHVPWCFRIS